MLATTLTAAIVGIEARLIHVEADVAGGFPRFVMVGLPDSAVKESEARIRAALRNCGYSFKWDRRITVNLAPASLRKFGSSYDLATAVGLLVADGSVARERFSRALLVGELALDGAVRPVSGVLPMWSFSPDGTDSPRSSCRSTTTVRQPWSPTWPSIPWRHFPRRWPC